MDIWVNHIKAALQTDLTDEQCKIISVKNSNNDEDDVDDGEGLYECISTMKEKVPQSSSSVDAVPDAEGDYSRFFVYSYDDRGNYQKSSALKFGHSTPFESLSIIDTSMSSFHVH